MLNNSHLCNFLQPLVKTTHLAKNEIIAIFWGECISSYGWRRDPAPLCGKGARFVPAINNLKQFSSPFHTILLHYNTCIHQCWRNLQTNLIPTFILLLSLHQVHYCVYNSLLVGALRSILLLFFHLWLHILSGLFSSSLKIKSVYALTYKCKPWPFASVCYLGWKFWHL